MKIIFAFITFVMINITYGTPRPTAREPTPRPTPRPTSENHIFSVFYNVSGLEADDFTQIDPTTGLSDIDLKEEISDDIRDAIRDTLVTSVTPAPTEFWTPIYIEGVIPDETKGTCDFDIEFEVYWKVSKDVEKNQKGTTFPAKMQEILRNFFNNTALTFAVDTKSLNVDSSAVFTLITVVLTVVIAMSL
eukprot:87810_1